MKLLRLLMFVWLYYFLRYIVLCTNLSHFFISFLDVGQGDSILINIPKYGQVLIDTGANYQSNHLFAMNQVFPVCTIKSVIITHYDSDHSGGLKRIMNYCSHAVVYDNLSYGDSFNLEGVLFLVLSPLEKFSTHQENSDSIVLLVKQNDFEVLLTGDAELENLNIVANNIERLRNLGFIENGLDIYKVSHHGSSHNSSNQLIQILSPKQCVVSVGKNNYGHPNQDVLTSLEKVGCKVRLTLDKGTITYLSR